MAELTTEYLDQKLDQAFEKFEIRFEAKMDTKLNKLETRFDARLEAQTKELKSFTEKQVEKLAIMVQRNVVEPMNLRGFKI